MISAHLVGQCVCEHSLDGRHRAMVPERIWGDGDPEGVRRRAAEGVKDAARAAAAFGADVVTGFTGSSIGTCSAASRPTREAWSMPAFATSPIGGIRS